MKNRSKNFENAAYQFTVYKLAKKQELREGKITKEEYGKLVKAKLRELGL